MSENRDPIRPLIPKHCGVVALLENKLVRLEKDFSFPYGYIDDMTPGLNSIAGSVQTGLQSSTVEYDVSSTSSA